MPRSSSVQKHHEAVGCPGPSVGAMACFSLPHTLHTLIETIIMSELVLAESRQPDSHVECSSGLKDDESIRDVFTDCLRDEKNVGRSSCPHKAVDDILTLNLGGTTTVQTLRRTLTIVEGSLLAARFSQNWQHSLPRDSQGSIFIDYDPGLFMPLLDYLRSLSAASTHLQRGILPITPSFSDVINEAAFRTMVDSLLLTNVLYNYEVHRYENEMFRMVTQEVPIFDYTMACTNRGSPDAPSCVSYCLGRPVRGLGDCHTRRVQAFDVVCDLSTVTPDTRVVVGWTVREPVKDKSRLQSIVYDTKLQTLKWIRKEGKWTRGETLALNQSGETVSVRCCIRLGTNELEWYVDEVLVALTNASLPDGKFKMTHGLLHVGVVHAEPDTSEWVPYIKVYSSGRCRFSAIELED